MVSRPLFELVFCMLQNEKQDQPRVNVLPIVIGVNRVNSNEVRQI